jgi:broad specificity phosphatase PhoE
MRTQPLASLIVASAVMLLAGGSLGSAPATLADSASTTLYFLRHGETQRLLVGTGPGTFAEVCTPTRSCCDTPLNPLGVARRDALAEWFVNHGIAKRLTHLIATNKPRTVQTLTALAVASGLGGDRDGDGVLDGADDDLLPGDGIQQFPAHVRECDPGFEATTGSQPHIVEAILALPRGSRAVVANHSETLYSIIAETTGIDTSDPLVFPKEDGSTTRVRNFNDLWIVSMQGTGAGVLVRHLVFDIAVRDRKD